MRSTLMMLVVVGILGGTGCTKKEEEKQPDKPMPVWGAGKDPRKFTKEWQDKKGVQQKGNEDIKAPEYSK